MEYAARLTKTPSRRTMVAPIVALLVGAGVADRRLRPHRQRRHRHAVAKVIVVEKPTPNAAVIPGKNEAATAAAISQVAQRRGDRRARTRRPRPRRSRSRVASSCAARRRARPSTSFDRQHVGRRTSRAAHATRTARRTRCAPVGLASPRRGARPSGTTPSRRPAPRRGACASDLAQPVERHALELVTSCQIQRAADSMALRAPSGPVGDGAGAQPACRGRGRQSTDLVAVLDHEVDLACRSASSAAGSSRPARGRSGGCRAGAPDRSSRARCSALRRA